MICRNRLPRPVREARKMKVLTVYLTKAADRKARTLARNFRTSPEVVLGLFITFELARLSRPKRKK